MYKVSFPSLGGGNRIKLFGKKIKWGRREGKKGRGSKEGIREGERKMEERVRNGRRREKEGKARGKRKGK